MKFAKVKSRFNSYKQSEQIIVVFDLQKKRTLIE